jgi:hypothetical protein
MKHKILSVMLAVLVIAAGSINTASAGVVTTDADSGPGSLRDVIAGAQAGDEITFDSGMEGKTIILNSMITIDKNITIKGSSQKLVPAEESYPAIYLPDNNGAVEPIVSISRIWIDGFNNTDHRTGGKPGGRGGAISAGKTGTLKLYSCIFSNNRAEGEGMAISKIWNPNGTRYDDRFFAYGCTFYKNGSEKTIFLHEEPPFATGNVFIENEGAKSIEYAPAVTPEMVSYNAYNTTLADGDLGDTNLKLEDNPLNEEDLIPTSDVIKILPKDLSTLPDDYPTVDFYGRQIKSGGYAGAAQFVCYENGVVVECIDIPVESIALEETTVVVFREYTTVQMKPVFIPANATNKTVIWSVEDDDIATVSDKGVVSGLKTGTTVITATTEDGGFEATATVVVAEPDPCVYRYPRDNWTATYGSSGEGRPNGPTCLFDDNYKEDGIGWHNAGGAGERRFAETVVVDMGESKPIGKIVCYSTGYIGDIVVYLSDTEVAPVHNSDSPGFDNPYPVGLWNCPATTEEIDRYKSFYGKGDGVSAAYRMEINVEGDRSGQYIIIGLLNSRGGGTVEWSNEYRNMSEVEVFQPCQPVTWDISSGDVNTVIASLEGSILFVRGAGAMKDFPELDDKGYKGSSAPWIVNVEYEADGTTVKSISPNPVSTGITDVVIDDGVTNVGANFAWDNNGTAMPKLSGLILSGSVTSIGSRAFNGVPLAGSIVIPENIVTIGNYAFDDSGRGSVTNLTLPSTFAPAAGVSHIFDNLKLQNVYIAAEVPPVFDVASEAIFTEDTYNNATLHVPYGTTVAYKAAFIWNNFKSIEAKADEIPEVKLPYTTHNRIFAYDILPFLTGLYFDTNSDGVIAVKFTVNETGTLLAECPIHTLYLFNDEELVGGNEIAKANESIANKELEPGTYYLIVDDFIVVTDFPVTIPENYTMHIAFSPRSVANANRTVKSVTRYDLLGRQLRSNATGIVIRRITYDDGSIETRKEYIRD